MKTLDAFLSRLLPLVPSCTDPLARQALLDAAIEFCEESHVLQVTSDPQAVTAGVNTYDLDLPSEEDAVCVLKAWYGTTLLSPAPRVHVNSILAYTGSAGGVDQPMGPPKWYYEIAPGTICIYPAPDQSAELMFSARVATKPKRTATQLNDMLFDNYIDAIIAGAQARIVAIPGQFFTANPAKAEQAFRIGISRAKGISIRGQVQASLSVSPRPFA